MRDREDSVLNEIRDMLQVLVDGQQQLINEVKELKLGQKKLHDEIRISNFILNNISVGSEIVN